MGRIPEEKIEEILAATDIVDVVSSYFPLKRAGSVFKANCPFHNEKTPSFNVNPAWQNYKCFGCGEGGNAIGFVMKYENVPFIDAVKKLALKASVTIIEEEYNPEADRKRRKSSRYKELNNITARYYHSLLLKSPDAQHARDYMKSRGFTKEIAEKWLIGWAPKNSRDFLGMVKEKGFNGREIINAGLGGMRDQDNPRSGLYNKFYDQLMFPILNSFGDVVGFSGRVLRADDKRGKYINTNETVLFKKSELLFGLDKAIKPMGKEKFALICEGQLDAIALHEAGFENAIAPLGTAFTEQHAKLLKRYTDHIILCYDGDGPGIAAADKAFIQLAAVGFPVKLVHLPEGDDPDTFLKSHGPEKFEELLEGARDFFEAKLDKELPTKDLSSPNDRANFLQSLADLVGVISDDLVRDATIQSLATRMRLGSDDFRNIVTASRNKPKYQDRRRRDDNQPQEEVVQASPMDPTIAYLCHLALASRAVADDLSEQLESLHEALEATSGGLLLKTILGRRPAADTSSARQAFLTTLPESDRLALEKGFSQDLPGDLKKASSETTSLLLSSYFQKKEAALRAQIGDPSLPPEQIMSLLQEIKDMQEFLSNLNSRFIR
ncbi:DNA primase [Akkermansiaceae bacterium]|nr:DNA primase [Akkermansiaceae bacterium]MDB4286443.1 DNA primase [bacterium]MDA7519239.1 DNA primase [Akkermansiaceae bacterium]MDA7862582.1 DNA primase [Akkermansiaceae bacterium]MDA7864017.1 DNA primase [Akkermansiaceae bacterium]